MARPIARRTRARLAITAATLWLLGVEVLPAVHQAGHAAARPHRHDAGGLIVVVTYDEPSHRHADGTVHRHGEADDQRVPAKRRPATRDVARIADPSDHAAGGLAHHAQALLPAPPPPDRPLPVDRRPVRVVDTAPATIAALAPCTPTARGPPAAA